MVVSGVEFRVPAPAGSWGANTGRIRRGGRGEETR